MTLIIFWFIFSPITFGAMMADFSHNFQTTKDGKPSFNKAESDPYQTWRGHLGICVGVAFAGPFGFVASLISSNLYRHGFVWSVKGVKRIIEK